MEPKPLSWSALKHMAKSPLEYRYRIDHPTPDKPAYLLGRAIHCLVLEPEHFDERYALCEITRNPRHKAYQEWMAEHPDAEALKPDEWHRVRSATDAVMSHRVAAEVLTGCRHEEPMEWVDPDTGLKCRGRVDLISSAYVAELKMTRHIEPRSFAADAARYGYHGQLGGLYHTGATVLRKIDGNTPPFFIAVDPEPPHDVAVMQMCLEDLAAGRALVLSLMQRLELCVATSEWPGVAPDLVQLQLPPWAPGLSTDESEEW